MATVSHKPKPRKSTGKKTAKRAKAADDMSAETLRHVEKGNAHLLRAWQKIYESHRKGRKRSNTSRSGKNHL